MVTSAREHFGRVASAYATSTPHARGEELARLAALVPPGARLLDVGTGAGHALAATAERASLAIGLDATPQMLAVARDVLRGRDVVAQLVEADSASLPFATSSIDVVVSRLAAHHFPAVEHAFGEVARVLRQNGVFLFVDNYAPDEPMLERWLDELERTRDPSHVRSHTLTGWLSLMKQAGFATRVDATLVTALDTEDWLVRSQTSEPNARRAREMLRTATPTARETFRIHDRGFSLLKALIVATPL